MISSSVVSTGALVWLCTLLFVWPIPHTIALRNILLISGFLWMLVLCRHRLAEVFGTKTVHVAAIGFAVISVWLVLQAGTIAAFPSRTWGELKGQWLPALISMFTGVFVGYCATTKRAGFDERRLMMAIAGVMIGQIGLTILDALKDWWVLGQLPLAQARLTGTKSGASYINNMLLAMLCADLLARINGTRKLLPFGRPAFFATLALSLFATHQLGARNGVVGVAFLTLSTIALLIFDNKGRLPIRKVLAVALCAICIVVALAWMNLKSDPRWLVFRNTVPIALDTDRYRAWMNTNSTLPLMENGQPVDHSAYMRIAWIKEGAKLVSEYPMGLGFDRNAFGAGLQLKFGLTDEGGSSHSGWLDWAIATGIPGTVLLFGLLVSLLVMGARAYLVERSPQGLVLAFLVAGFSGRMLVDGISRDHFLQQFMFLIGVFLSLVPRHHESAADQGRKSTYPPD